MGCERMLAKKLKGAQQHGMSPGRTAVEGQCCRRNSGGRRPPPSRRPTTDYGRLTPRQAGPRRHRRGRYQLGSRVVQGPRHFLDGPRVPASLLPCFHLLDFGSRPGQPAFSLLELGSRPFQSPKLRLCPHTSGLQLFQTCLAVLHQTVHSCVDLPLRFPPLFTIRRPPRRHRPPEPARCRGMAKTTVLLEVGLRPGVMLGDDLRHWKRLNRLSARLLGDG
mmetsp:Transcript_40272/g.108020  ORF Transcript_40272/g.108020 Transcript_40272/m.108020 type:complete len:220 (-) Transcript_40272:595-1254(-)